MQRNQIDLKERPIEQNKAFLQALYNTVELDGLKKWFDKLVPGNFKREKDKEMTLDKFLQGMVKPFVTLQIGTQILPELIKYGATYHDSEGISRYAFLECPLDIRNYVVIFNLFKEAYKQDLMSVPVTNIFKPST